MSKTLLTLPSLVLGLTLGLGQTALADEDRHAPRDAHQALLKMAQAMGGLERLKSVKQERIVASGSRFEGEQTFLPGEPALHVADFSYDLTQQYEQRRSHNQWQVDAHYPAINHFNYREVINGEHGAIFGVDGFFSSGDRPMPAMRLAARSEQYLMNSPLALLKHALARVNQLRIRSHDDDYVLIMPGLDRPIHLYFDEDSALPRKAVTIEDDSVLGDARWEVIFRQWQTVEGVATPMTTEFRLNGKQIRREWRDLVSYSEVETPALFEVPTPLQTALNQNQFRFGLQMSQWLSRFILLGPPFDLDQRGAASILFQTIAPGVHHIVGGIHNSMVVEMKDYLVLIEPVLYNERSDNILIELKQRWPDKPVKYVIPTHFHNDHMGGIRSYAAAGATLIVGHGTKRHYRKVLSARHRAYPDALSKKRMRTKIIELDESETMILDDGQRRIHLLPIANSHSGDALAPYIEDARLIFTGDLYNPQAFPVPLPSGFATWGAELAAVLKASDLNIETIAGAHGATASYAQFLADVEASN